MTTTTTTTSSSGGIGFCGMLTILFIGLRLTDNIGWSWWWVLSPLWIPAGIVLAVLCVVGAIAAVVWVAESIGSKLSRKRKLDRDYRNLYK